MTWDKIIYIVAEIFGGISRLREKREHRRLAYTYAKTFLGIAEVEGPKSNPVILDWIHQHSPHSTDDSKYPWCGLFVAAMMRLGGLPVVFQPGTARNWLSWGAPVSRPKEGDLVILARGRPEDNEGHVGFFISRDSEFITILGGNQDDKVGIHQFPGTQLIQFRKAP